MYKSERIIKAIGNIDDQIVERVGFKRTNAGAANSRSRRRKVGTIFLVAAVLTALFTVTAYAMGWFGLSARVSPLEAPPSLQGEALMASDGGYLSFNGYADTPEGKANAEWESFRLSYRSPLSPEESRAWDDAHKDDPAAAIYGAVDDATKSKLHEIAEKYDLELHSTVVTPGTAETFFQITGLSPFLNDSNSFSAYYVYEDGSFSAEAELDGGWLRLNRGATGALYPATAYISELDNYDEWQVTSSDGIIVNVAQERAPDENDNYQGWLFTEVGTYLITAQYCVPQGDTTHSSVEALIDHISFAELGNGQTDLSVVLAAAPTEAKPQGTLLTVEEWMNSPEYHASVGFQRAYNDWYDENGRIAVANRDNGYVKGEYDKGYFGDFPCNRGNLDETMAFLASEYGLTPPTSSQAIMRGSWVNPDNILETMWSDGHLETLGIASTQDGWDLIGCDSFLNYDPQTFVRWDNGSWRVDMICYVPYGCINPVIRAIGDPAAYCWAYDSACGAQVLLCRSGISHYPEMSESHILYDTGTGYVIVRGSDYLNEGEETHALEQMADSIDFTKIP